MPKTESLDIKALYQEENYYSENGGSGMTSDGYMKNGLNDGLSKFYFNIRLKELANKLPNDRHIRYLDYGSSAGQIVAMAERELGWDAHGVDLSPTSVAHAKALGINVSEGDIETLLKAGKTFNAVSLYHCLEHIIDPKDLLVKIREILEEGGLIAIEVPNIYSSASKIKGENWKGLLLPYHIHHFHEQSLIQVLEDSGYQIEKAWTPYYPQASAEIFNIAKFIKKLKGRTKASRAAQNEVSSDLKSNVNTELTELSSNKHQKNDLILKGIYYPFDKTMAMMNQGEALSIIARKI